MPHGPQPLRVPTGGTQTPLYKLLKMSGSFHWTDKTQKALDELKELISKPPVLASPEPGETLLLYVAATTQVISVALMVEWEEPGHVYKVQRPVYHTSKVHSDCETHYN
jgi:dsDNA-binding SOS-regulon protein